MSSTQEEVRRRARELRLATCNHWRGALTNPPCSAGVDLVARVGPRREEGWVQRVPCLGSSQAVFECERRETPTEAEVEARQRAMLEMFDHVRDVIAAIPGNKTIRSGEVPCPKCGGRVAWSRSPTNGHLSAACSTLSCIAFME